MIRMKDIIKASIYYDKINCLLSVLADVQVRQISNIPVIVGRSKICGIDIYSLTAELWKQKTLLEVMVEVAPAELKEIEEIKEEEE